MDERELQMTLNLSIAAELTDFLDQLESGEQRVATPQKDGTWAVHAQVKENILKSFREGQNIDMGSVTQGQYQGFIDKHTIPPRLFNIDHKVRLVPGGSSVRRGAYVAPSVIIMPPSFINIGAYIDEGTMVDSHVLVGSCAQIGKKVHLSAGVQIGGVLEPIQNAPVIVEDEAFIGADAILVEGIHIKSRAVIAPGVVLSGSLPIYDSVHQMVLEKGSAIPENAVVVSGTRPISSAWGKSQGLNVYCPIIIKYRDDKTDLSVLLEDTLRQ
jgi:2,3,4,5-tetrahydropyridine-2-carboxylate N-succinyltransferase